MRFHVAAHSPTANLTIGGIVNCLTKGDIVTAVKDLRDKTSDRSNQRRATRNSREIRGNKTSGPESKPNKASSLR